MTVLFVLCATSIVLAAGVLEWHAINKGIDGKCLTAFLVFASLVVREVIAKLIQNVKEHHGKVKSPRR